MRPSNLSSSSNSFFRYLIAPLATVLLLGAPSALAAQDMAAPPSLEDLIPDAAVEAPEAWARQGDGDAPQTAPDDDPEQFVAPAFDTPLAEFPPPPLAWPDEQDLPPIETIEPEGPMEFVQLDPDLADPFADTEAIRVSPQLEIALPADPVLFPVRDEFLGTFASLSAVEELHGNGDNIAVLAARARADEELLGTLLRTYGYYDGQVVRSVAGALGASGASTDGRAPVRFAILPGPRYRFGAIDLGDLAAAPDYSALRASFAIQPGDPLSSFAVVAQQSELDRALGETGYPFAAIEAPELLIDHARAEGDLTLPVRSNGKYVFGEVTSSLPQFLSGEHLAEIARFAPGDVYQRSLALDLQRAIIATGLVSAAKVTPRAVVPPADGAPGVVAMDVELAKAKLRTIAGAIGYGTEDGLRVEASWEHRNLFPPEGALKVRSVIGTREQLAGITFKRNNFGRRDQVLNIDGYARDAKTDSVEARTVGLSTSLERLSNLLFQKPFSWGLGAEVLFSDERNRVIDGIPRPRQTYLTSGVFGRATIDGSDSLLDPTTGYRLTAFVEPEVSHTLGQESFYVRTQFDASAYRTIRAGTVLAGRVRLATIVGAETFQIAPSRRLYAGGANSVRGFGYQAVGPRNDLGEPTGGRSLVEFSLEARIDTGLFDGALQLVPFVDGGAVSIDPTPDFRFVKYGAGLGIRYKTGFGPIRVDVGVPLNRDRMFDSPVAVYVSLGQAF